VILGFAIAAPFGLIVLWPYSPVAAIGVLALSHALLLYPTLRPNVQWLGPVVTRFATDRKEIWLTIDDGPTTDTPAVLDLFDAHSVKATFFVKGILANEHGQLVRDIIARGHSVANHSQTHPSASFWCLLPGRVSAEIEECNRALASATGTTPRWFRAPVGHKNPFVHPALARRGMRLIGWTARGFDAVVSDPAHVVARILPKVEPGAIVVLHQGREYSLRVLERVITALRERGYEFVIPDDAQLSVRRPRLYAAA
jgi:peptidoglycan-N-acetylglucosamine deacetylase